jgi:sugar phosphate isomerase/epimerase
MTARARDLCQEAAAMGLTIAIEAEYGFAVGTPDELERFLDETGAPNLAVNYDPTHFVRAGFGVRETVRRFAKRIVHVHLKEYLPEAVPPTLFTGERVGSPAWATLDELAAIGYDGIASVETLAELVLPAETLATTAWNAIQKWQEKTT